MMKLTTLALATLALTAPVDAQPSLDDGLREKIAGMMEKFDKNEDGQISKAEAGRMWSKLAKADANRDGGVTPKELYDAWSGGGALFDEDPIMQRVDGLFARFDKNEDGLLTKEEAGRLWPRIVGADTDGDGKVNKKDVYKHWTKKS